MDVESEVKEPTNLDMLELVTILRTPSITRELIKCVFKLLDGAPIACESGIGGGFNVVLRVSFSIVIMTLVFSFKSLN